MKKYNILILFSILIIPIIIFLYYISIGNFYIISYRRFFMLIKTILYALNVSIITSLLGIFIALFLIKNYKNIKSISIFLLSLMAIPPYMYAYILLSKNVNLAIKYGFLSSVFLQSLYLLPLSISVYILYISSISNIYFEQSFLDSTYKNSTYKVIFTLLKKPSKILILILLILTISDFTIPSIFAFNTYPIEIFTVFSSNLNLSNSAVVSLPLIFLNLLLAFFLINSEINIGDFFTDEYNFLVNSSNNKKLLKILLIITLFISLLSIYNALKYNSDNYIVTSLKDDFLFTIKTSIISSIITTILAYYLSYYYTYKKYFKKTILIILIISFSIPGTIIGLIINTLYQFLDTSLNINLLDTSIPIIHAYITKFLPISFLILWIGFTKINKEHIDIIMLNTKNIFAILFKGIWHNIKYYFSASIIIIIILTSNELSSTLMLIPAGKSTLTITIYNFLHYGNSQMVNYLITIIFISILFFIFIFNIMQKIYLKYK